MVSKRNRNFERALPTGLTTGVHGAKAGFTLVELLLVGVIISIIGGVIVSVVNVPALRARSRDAKRTADLDRVQVALEAYFADNLFYPATDSLDTLVPGYISELPTDPRSEDSYCYASDGEVYVLAADMEVSDVSEEFPCTSLAEWSSLGGSCSYTRCYGVESPLAGSDLSASLCGGSICAPGQRCINGTTCVCDSVSCAGCCNGNTCESGTAKDMCGIGGASCQSCGGSSTCSGGNCVGGYAFVAVPFGDGSPSCSDFCSSRGRSCNSSCEYVGWMGRIYVGGFIYSNWPFFFRTPVSCWASIVPRPPWVFAQCCCSNSD